MDILKLIVSNTDNCSQFNVNEFQVICVDVQMPGHGDVQGNKYGSRKLCISRQNTNHFVPLIRDNRRRHTSASNHSIQSEATSSNATPSLVSHSNGSSSFVDLSMCAARSSTNASSGSAADVMNNDARRNFGVKKRRRSFNLVHAFSCAASDCGDSSCNSTNPMQSLMEQGMSRWNQKQYERPSDVSEQNPSNKTILPANEYEEMHGPFNDSEDDNAEAADDVTSVSDMTESDAMSDDNDIFDAQVIVSEMLPDEYKENFLYRWIAACADLMELLRDDVWLPLKPRSNDVVTSKDVQSGIIFPPWHCTFQNCDVVAQNLSKLVSHEAEVWSHIWGTDAQSGAHRAALKGIIGKHRLRRTNQEEREIAFTLYSKALQTKERAGVPAVGLATDRRAMLHLGEVFYEENIQAVMCFICGCKHILHCGFNKFGESQEKGSISFRNKAEERKILERVLQCTPKSADEYRCWLLSKQTS